MDLGSLDKIIIGQEGKGDEAGWYLNKVVIREDSDEEEEMKERQKVKERREGEFVFECYR